MRIDWCSPSVSECDYAMEIVREIGERERMRSCDVQWPPTLRDTLPSAQQQSAANIAHEWIQNEFQIGTI